MNKISIVFLILVLTGCSNGYILVRDDPASNYKTTINISGTLMAKNRKILNSDGSEIVTTKSTGKNIQLRLVELRTENGVLVYRYRYKRRAIMHSGYISNIHEKSSGAWFMKVDAGKYKSIYACSSKTAPYWQNRGNCKIDAECERNDVVSKKGSDIRRITINLKNSETYSPPYCK